MNHKNDIFDTTSTPLLVSSKTYSNVQVFEQPVPGTGISVMLRRDNNFVNATQILKAAGIDKGRRTKILERQVCLGVHEKIQGGFGKFQGTWVPLPKAMDLAEQYGMFRVLESLFASVTGSVSKEISVSQPFPQNEPFPQLPSLTLAPCSRKRSHSHQTSSYEKDNSCTSDTFKDDVWKKKRQIDPWVMSLSSASMASSSTSTSSSPSLDNGGEREEDHLHELEEDEVNVEEEDDDDDDKVDDLRNYQKANLSLDLENEFKVENSSGDHNLPKMYLEIDGEMGKTLFKTLLIENRKVKNDHDINVEPHSKSNFVGLLVNTLKSKNLDHPLDDFYDTALHWTSLLGNLEISKQIIVTGNTESMSLSTITRKNRFGETSLMKTVHWPFTYFQGTMREFCRLLEPSFFLSDLHDRTVLHHIFLGKDMTGWPDATRCSAIMSREQILAMTFHYTSVVLQSLYDKVVPLNEGTGRPVPDINAFNITNNSVQTSYHETIRRFVDQQDYQGDTALHLAARLNDYNSCQLLLLMGADPNKKNHHGQESRDIWKALRNSQNQLENQNQKIDSASIINDNLQLEPTANAWLSLKLILECDSNIDQEVIDALHKILTDLEGNFGKVKARSRKSRQALVTKLTTNQRTLKDRDETIKGLEGQVLKLQKRCFELEQSAALERKCRYDLSLVTKNGTFGRVSKNDHRQNQPQNHLQHNKQQQQQNEDFTLTSDSKPPNASTPSPKPNTCFMASAPVSPIKSGSAEGHFLNLFSSTTSRSNNRFPGYIPRFGLASPSRTLGYWRAGKMISGSILAPPIPMAGKDSGKNDINVPEENVKRPATVVGILGLE